MKKNVYPSLALVPVFFCCSYAYSQNGLKSNTIVIEKSDTVVNGRKLSELSKSDRDKFRNELKDIREKVGDSNKLEIKGTGIIVERNSQNPSRVFSFNNSDSVLTRFRFNEERLPGAMNDDLLIPHAGPITKSQRLVIDDAFSFRTGYERPNSQSFSFNSTDKNGISTRISIKVTEPDKEELNRIIKSPATENKPGIKDLVMYPNFSAGNISLSFKLETKGIAEVKLTDSDDHTLFTEKLNGGNFLKQVNLPKNGVYYLTVRQGNAWLVKKIIKQ